MISQKCVLKTAAAILIASALAFSGEADRADAKMPKMDRNDLVQATQYVLQKESSVKMLSAEITAQARNCGDLVKGDYEVEPEQIIPWLIENGKAVSVVTVKTKGSKQPRTYKFAVLFKDDGYHIVYLYPGTSNTDPILFSDLLPAAEGQAQAHLKSKEVTLKDTRVLGTIEASGWNEEWLWANKKGRTHRMKIIFTTAPGGGGTSWSIKEL